MCPPLAKSHHLACAIVDFAKKNPTNHSFHPEGKSADTHARKIATASVAVKSCAPGHVETNSYNIQLRCKPKPNISVRSSSIYCIQYVNLQIKFSI